MSEITIEGKNHPLIPPGKYTVVYTHHETNRSAFGGKPKVYLNFRMVDPGFIGQEIFAAYNVKGLIGRPKKNGSFKLTRRQDLTLQLATIMPNFRLDRVSLRPLISRTVEVSVRSVVKDYRQRALPVSLQYSVVDKILAIVDGGPCP
jgi:hypothetical protein